MQPHAASENPKLGDCYRQAYLALQIAPEGWSMIHGDMLSPLDRRPGGPYPNGHAVLVDAENNLHDPVSDTQWPNGVWQHVYNFQPGSRTFTKSEAEQELKKHRGVVGPWHDTLTDYEKFGREASVNPIKTHVPWADLMGLTKQQSAFQRTHPIVRERILTSLLQNGNIRTHDSLINIHRIQSRVDALRARQGRPSPYAHPSQPQPWHNPTGADQTMFMPKISAIEEGDTQYGLGTGHVAPDDGPPFHDPEANLPDVYDHPEYYVTPKSADLDSHRAGMENWRALKAARGNPEADVAIYRAVPHGITHIEGNTNPAGASWVSASPTYAAKHAWAESCPSCGGDMQVIKGTAKAKDLHTEGYLEEWGYTGDPIHDPSALSECPEGAFEARKAAEEEYNRRYSSVITPGRDTTPRYLSVITAGRDTTDESGLKAAGIAIIAMDTGRVLMQQRALNPIMCPCGQGVTWDEQNGYQHDDGSVSHDDEYYGQTVSDLLDQGHDDAFDKTAAVEYDPNEGTWEFPGGKLDDGESPRAAAVREFREEVGQELPPGVFVGAWVSPGGLVTHASLEKQSGEVPFGDLMDFQSKGWDQHPTLPNHFERNDGGFYHRAEYHPYEGGRDGHSWVLASFADGMLIGGDGEDYGHSIHDTAEQAMAKAKDRERQWVEEGVRGDKFAPPMSQRRPTMIPSEDDKHERFSPEDRWLKAEPLDISKLKDSNPLHPLNMQRLNARIDVTPEGYPHGFNVWQDTDFPITKQDRYNHLDQPMVGLKDDEEVHLYGAHHYVDEGPVCDRCYDSNKLIPEKHHKLFATDGHDFEPLLPAAGERRLGSVKPVYKGFIYLIQNERDIDLTEREHANPDDPDGDMTEQSAWWDIEHAKKNPALRQEVADSTPWDELELWADKSVRSNREVTAMVAKLSARDPYLPSTFSDESQPAQVSRTKHPNYDEGLERTRDPDHLNNLNPSMDALFELKDPLESGGTPMIVNSDLSCEECWRGKGTWIAQKPEHFEQTGHTPMQPPRYVAALNPRDPDLRPKLPEGLKYQDGAHAPFQSLTDPHTGEETHFWRWQDPELPPPWDENGWIIGRQIGENETHGRSVDWQPMIIEKPQTDYSDEAHFDRAGWGAKTNVQWNDPICETCYLRYGHTISAYDHDESIARMHRSLKEPMHEFKEMTPDRDQHGNLRESAVRVNDLEGERHHVTRQRRTDPVEMESNNIPTIWNIGGEKYLEKRLANYGGKNEFLSSLVGRALGADVSKVMLSPFGRHDYPSSVLTKIEPGYQDYIDMNHIARSNYLDNVVKSTRGVRIGLLDTLVNVYDHGSINHGWKPDPSEPTGFAPHSIDYESSFNSMSVGQRQYLNTPFSHHFVDAGGFAQNNALTPNDVIRGRVALESLKPIFNILDSEHHHEALMHRWEALEKNAAGVEGQDILPEKLPSLRLLAQQSQPKSMMRHMPDKSVLHAYDTGRGRWVHRTFDGSEDDGRYPMALARQHETALDHGGDWKELGYQVGYPRHLMGGPAETQPRVSFSSVKTAAPTTSDEPTLNRVIRTGDPNDLEVSQGARVHDVTLPSGDWIAKSPLYRELHDPMFNEDPDDVKFFHDRASEGADVEEFAARLAHALGNPNEEPIAPEAVRGNPTKAADPTPTVYVRKYHNFTDAHDIPESESNKHVDTPRGKIIGYFHSVLGEGDHPWHHNMIEVNGQPVSIDHGASSLPEYAQALKHAEDEPDHVRYTQWQHQHGLSPYENHFLILNGAGWPVRLQKNPLAQGDTARALAASETLRPWARERGREDWLDAAQKRMRMLGRSAASEESLFPYQMPHERHAVVKVEAASNPPTRKAHSLIREEVIKGRPEFSLRAPDEVHPAHHDMIMDNERPDYHEEPDLDATTPRIYSLKSNGRDNDNTRHTFLAPVLHNETGDGGWLRGTTGRDPQTWKVYPDTDAALANAIKGREPYYTEPRSAEERYVRGYPRGHAVPKVTVDPNLGENVLQEGDPELDDQGHQVVEPRRDTWAELGEIRGFADEPVYDGEDKSWTDLNWNEFPKHSSVNTPNRESHWWGFSQ